MTPSDTQELINKLIETGENEYIEFKKDNRDPDKIGKNISALSNSALLQNEEFGYSWLWNR